MLRQFTLGNRNRLVAVFGGCIVAFMAACASHPKRVTPLPSTPGAAPAPAPATTQSPAAPALPQPSAKQPDHIWLDAEGWAKANGYTPVEMNGERMLFSQGTNELTITLSNRVVRWNGIQVGLGYAPRLANNRPVVHSLDVQKTLQVIGRGGVPKVENPVVVIDPGHGGGNSGTKSILSASLEKDLTLDVAKRLKPLLELNGWTVFLTRTNDADVSLPERAAFADRQKASLFLSIHFNATGSTNSTSPAGLETYCATPTGLPSNLTREYEDDTTKIFPNNRFDAENLSLALKIHRSSLNATGLADRGVKRARFMTVLRLQNRPAVLVEGGYLSHPEEARKVENPEFRQRLAEGIAEGLGKPDISAP